MPHIGTKLPSLRQLFVLSTAVICLAEEQNETHGIPFRSRAHFSLQSGSCYNRIIADEEIQNTITHYTKSSYKTNYQQLKPV